MTTQPNEEQLNAICAFADKYGTNWRTELLSAWIYGTDAREPNGHLLRQVRNQFGPRWLERFVRGG